MTIEPTPTLSAHDARLLTQRIQLVAANRAAAQRMADRCYRALGVSIDIDAEAVAS